MTYATHIDIDTILRVFLPCSILELQEEAQNTSATISAKMMKPDVAYRKIPATARLLMSAPAIDR